MIPPMLLRAAVFLITFSGLTFEIGLTRIYSATIWYHFTFVAVSVALLGWGLGGLALHLTRRRVAFTLDRAGALAAAYGASVLLCLWIVAHLPTDLNLLPVFFVPPLVPFVLAGMALSMIFDLRRHMAAALYFVDLFGASLGAAAVALLLQTLGGEGAVLVAAGAPFVAAACLSRNRRLVKVACGAACLVLAIANVHTGLFHVVPGTSKAMRRQMDQTPGTRVTQTGWNAYSRIDAVEGFPPPYLARLYIDADAWTSVQQWDGDFASVPELKSWYRALPFRFAPKADTLVIGPGGGADVLAALTAGSRHVTAVELNPLMIQFVRHYGARAGNLYRRPDVEIVQSEGRNFISRTDRHFDVIYLGFVDSWASVASGGLSLSENYLYTTQAFRDYLDHLTNDGELVILRWDLDIPRLVSNAVAVLGAEEAARRVVVLMEKRQGGPDEQPQMLFMLRKRPFSAAETNEIVTQWTLARPVIVPGRIATPPYYDVLAGRMSLAAFDAASPVRVGPVPMTARSISRRRDHGECTARSPECCCSYSCCRPRSSCSCSARSENRDTSQRVPTSPRWSISHAWDSVSSAWSLRCCSTSRCCSVIRALRCQCCSSRCSRQAGLAPQSAGACRWRWPARSRRCSRWPARCCFHRSCRCCFRWRSAFGSASQLPPSPRSDSRWECRFRAVCSALEKVRFRLHRSTGG